MAKPLLEISSRSYFVFRSPFLYPSLTQFKLPARDTGVSLGLGLIARLLQNHRRKAKRAMQTELQN
jgi:hypothetical protein